MKYVGSPRPTNSKEFRENYSAMEKAIEKVDSLAKKADIWGFRKFKSASFEKRENASKGSRS